MKCFSCMFIAFVVCYGQLSAQARKNIRVKAGDDMAQAYSPHGFYRFAQFSKAIVYFKGGSRNSGPLFNYNVLSGNMQFINPSKDTLDMANVAGIDSVVFDNVVFIYKDGFMEVAGGDDSIKLLRKLVLTTQAENIGAYGLANSTSSITSLKSFTSGTGVYNLVVNQNVVIDETITWFFSSGDNILKSSKGNFLKLLPAAKAGKADAYLKQNKTSFEKENDLKKLMAAIAG